MLAEIRAPKQGEQHEQRLRGLLEALQPAQGPLHRLRRLLAELPALKQGPQHELRLRGLLEVLQPAQGPLNQLRRLLSDNRALKQALQHELRLRGLLAALQPAQGPLHRLRRLLAEIRALKKALQHELRLRGLLEALQPAQGEIDRLGFTVTEFGAAQQGWDHVPRLLSLVEALQPPERQIDRLGRMPSQIITSQQRPQPIAGDGQVEVSRAPGHRGVEQVGRGVGWNRPQPLVEKVTGRRVEALAGQPGGDQRVPVGHRFARPDGQTHQCPQRIGRFAGFRRRQRLPQPSGLVTQPLVRLRTQRGIRLRFLRPQQPAQGGGIPPQHPSTAAGWS